MVSVPCRVTRAGLAPGEAAPELHPLHGMLQAGIFLLKAWDGLSWAEHGAGNTKIGNSISAWAIH